MHQEAITGTIAPMLKQKLLIGFVGQGYVGKNYADNLESRGYSVVRYSLEEPYRANKNKIKKCDIVFICVPTPTTSKGFDVSIVEAALKLVPRNKTAVIKSTILPGMTRKLQKKFPNIIVLFSPEFFSVATAKQDTNNPFMNIIGLPSQSARHKKAAEHVHSIIPRAPFTQTVTSDEAEITKYAHNMSGYTQVLTFNLLYDMAQHLGCNWRAVQEAIEADPLVCNRYANPVHKGGRGAGGFCFIKDLAAFSHLYKETIKRPEGEALLDAMQKNNIALLMETNKDESLLRDVYGSAVIRRAAKRARR